MALRVVVTVNVTRTGMVLVCWYCSGITGLYLLVCWYLPVEGVYNVYGVYSVYIQL